MKKNIAAIFSFLALTVLSIQDSLNAMAATPGRYPGAQEESLKTEKKSNALLGIGFGNYLVSDETFQQVYGKSGLIYGLEFAYSVYSKNNFELYLALEGRHFGKTGASTISQQEAKISLTPVSLSLEGVLSKKFISLFLGLGLDDYFYDEQSALKNTSGSTLGFHVNGGFSVQVPPVEFLKLKVYLRGTWARTTENDLNISLGGAEYGASLLYSFRLF